MTKHTPGPWTVERYVVDDDDREVSPWTRGDLRERRRIVAGGLIVADMVAGSPTDTRLIAAAPELLKALEMIVYWHDYWHDKDSAEGISRWQAAREAIRKARGESSMARSVRRA